MGLGKSIEEQESDNKKIQNSTQPVQGTWFSEYHLPQLIPPSPPAYRAAHNVSPPARREIRVVYSTPSLALAEPPAYKVAHSAPLQHKVKAAAAELRRRTWDC
jgi:hypothetical protein